jgi:Fic family protein
VASSKIEGLVIGPRRLLRAEAGVRSGEAALDVTAEEVLGNVEAMATAVHIASQNRPLRRDDILAIRQRLMERTHLAEHAGRMREVQNWIGGSDYNPCSASFVPPPPEMVPELIDDLVTFCNEEDLPAVAQAALAHAQFETIHPFIDGNGRAGRALIHVILRRRGLANRVLPPVSLVLDRVGPVRADSATAQLLDIMPGAPVLTVASAAELVGRSVQATNQAMNRLAEHDVVRPLRLGRQGRGFEAHEIITAFTDLERELTTAR